MAIGDPKARFEISADDKTAAAFSQVNARLKGMESGFSAFGTVAKTALGLFSANFAKQFIQQAAEAADQLGKTADVLGTSTDGLRAFQIAAQEAGTDVGASTKLLTESQKRLGEAATGTGEAAKYIELLGLKVKDLQALSPEQLFVTYADGINNLESKSEQFAATAALMGKAGNEAFAFIQGGSASLEEAAKFVSDYGLALDRVSIKQIEAANDAIGRLGIVSQAAGQQVAAGLSPFIELTSKSLLEATGNTESFAEAAGKAGAIVYTAVSIMSNGYYSLVAAIDAVGAASAKLAQQTVSNLTLGIKDDAFQATVDDYVTRGQANLDRIKSFEDIQRDIVQALEASRLAAQNAVNSTVQQAAGADASLVSPDTQAEINARIKAEQQFADQKYLINQFVNEAIFEEQINGTALYQQLAAQKIDLNRESEEQQLADIQAFSQQKIAVLKQELNYQVQLEQQAAAEKRAIQQGLTSAATSAFSAVANSELVSAKKRAAITKALALAQAIQQTYVGATLQLSTGDPYTAIFRAAAVVAFGLLQVAAIARTNYGSTSGASGGSPTSLGGSANPVYVDSSADQDQGAQTQTAVQLIFNAPIFSSTETAQWLIDTLEEQISDRDVVFISSSSRQAQELMS